MYDAFNSNDIERATHVVADEFELTDMATGKIHQGPEGLKTWLLGWKSFMPDATAEMTNGVAVGEWVATEHVGRGTHKGTLSTPAGETPPTGRSIVLKFAEVYRLRGGQIVRMRVYWDAASLLGQVGLIPWPAPDSGKRSRELPGS
jgi:ketosteroid isomerase-like protein